MNSTSYELHILNIGWRSQSTTKQPYQYIELYHQQSNQKSQIELKKGTELTWNISSSRICTGYKESGEHIPCPFNNPINTRSQCAYCSKKTGFVDAVFLKKQPNQKMQEHLAKPHIVYLAYFQPHTVKVGTSTKSRYPVRTIEQDALISVPIAESDGLGVLALESRISKLGFPQGVSSRHKRKYLGSIPNIEVAKDLLFMAWNRINQGIDSLEDGDLFEFESQTQFSSQILSHLENPNIYFTNSAKNIDYLPDVRSISGEFLGIRGKHFIWEYQGKLLSTNKDLVIGRSVEFIEQSSESIQISSSQPSLFD